MQKKEAIDYVTLRNDKGSEIKVGFPEEFEERYVDLVVVDGYWITNGNAHMLPYQKRLRLAKFSQVVNPKAQDVYQKQLAKAIQGGEEQ